MICEEKKETFLKTKNAQLPKTNFYFQQIKQIYDNLNTYYFDIFQAFSTGHDGRLL